eukprot:Phypoly_transcript_05200.p1 GENE.Phypoly_transcript_05200~~Phypoly_transcript_05200.p1  ORF type:complete len:411 (-),score=58.03 Phypoly_transcript_05200:13-1245(-)
MDLTRIVLDFFTDSSEFSKELCAEGGGAFIVLLNQGRTLLGEGKYQECRPIAKEIMEMGWERLHIGHWKDVPDVWRDFYSCGCFIFSICEVVSKNYASAIEALDKGLLMGGPLFQEKIKKMISEIQEIAYKTSRTRESENCAHDERPTKLQRIEPQIPEFTINPEYEIKRVAAPSMQQFFREYMTPKIPVIITGCMDHWPALNQRDWSDLEYLKKVAGMRTVPIEVGKTYLEETWSQKLMTFGDFIDQHVDPDKGPNSASGPNATGYLAQTQLFDQIPELRKDIETPIYCAMDADNDIFVVNAWFGPKGTTTPLHYDPHHNLLSQVVGAKYLRLYSFDHSDALYPHEGKMLFNTSQVDLENPDLEKFNKFSKAPYLECILQRGEMLYIPPKFWHFVKSLSISFSVSFWWS